MDKELIGKISKFKVLRETNIGYMLEKDSFEYFLHKNECNKRYLKNDEIVEAFLYFDNQKRVAATLFKPFVTLNNAALLKVKEVNYPLGVFLDNNISKDLLLSSDSLPKIRSFWPEKDDFVVVRLKKGSKQFKTVIKKDDFKKPENLALGDVFVGHVCLYVNDDFYVVNDNLEAVKVKRGDYLRKERLGKKVETKITYLGFNEILAEISFDREEYLKYKKMEVYRYIVKNKDNLSLSFYNKENVEKNLKMSNKQFKRIISLLKEADLIDIKNKKIIVKDEKK